MTGELARAHRLVVKIGSSLLVGPDGVLKTGWLRGFASDLHDLTTAGREVIVVSSGAIGLGRGVLGLGVGALRLEEKQAAAAAGQIALAHAYKEALAEVGRTCAQVLLTLDDTEDRRRYLNARATVDTLLRFGAVPVVNENDTVATTEIRFGDNDRLSARVAIMAAAELLVLLSDVDGLYTADPRNDPAAAHIDEVAELTPALTAMAGGAGSAVGTGGMASKLAAAELATRSGCAVIVTDGREARPLQRLAAGARHTVFHAKTSPRRAKKEWIAGAIGSRGALIVDDGAVAALRAGRSLLPAGVRNVDGHFQRGDAVVVKDGTGAVIAKGLIAYDADDARRLAGHRTDAHEQILGFRGRDEIIHRDHLVLL